jgi:hypothetical protein
MLKILLLSALICISLKTHATAPDSSLTRPLDSLCSDAFLLPKAAQYGLHPGEINRPELLLLFEQWRATPYRYGGRNEKGIDCSGFVNVLLSHVYETTIPGGSVSIYNQTRRISREELQEGDLVFFKIRKNRVSHVGMYLSNGKFMHATVHGGVMISDLDEAYYRRYYFGAGRF